MEVWIFAGFQTRAAIPLRLNYPGTFSAIGAASPGAYLAPPKDLKDLESRRRTWWMTIMFDRIASVGGWVHAIDERDIGTELPLRRIDFDIEARSGPPLCHRRVYTETRFSGVPGQSAAKSSRLVFGERLRSASTAVHRCFHPLPQGSHVVW